MFIMMTLHALAIGVQTAISCLMWHHYWIHSIFCVLILSQCAYNGAIRYYKMMTVFFIKGLEKIERKESS